MSSIEAVCFDLDPHRPLMIDEHYAVAHDWDQT